MFVGGLSWQTTEGIFKLIKPISFKLIFAEGLKDYFSKFGVVSEAMVMRDPTTKHSR